MATPSDADALRSVLADLSVLTTRDLVQLWRRFGDNPDFESIMVAAFPEIIGPPAQAAAAVTAQWYTELAPALPYEAFPVVNLPADRMLGSLEWAFNAPGEATPLDRITGSAQRMLFDVSRDTVLENLDFEYGDDSPDVQPAGTRWARHASANACSFCRVMATRGAVYRSAASATTVTGRSVDLTLSDRRARAAGMATTDELLARRSRYKSARAARRQGRSVGDTKIGALRGMRKRGERWHDNCRCVAVPVRPGQGYNPPEYVEQWEQDYITAVKAARDAGETRGDYGATDLNAVVRHMDRAR